MRLRGGIDEFGNFLGLSGVRVAISPYLVYADSSDFVAEAGRRARAAEKNGRLFLSELTRESKSYFMRQAGAAAENSANLEDSKDEPNANSVLDPDN